MDIQTTATTLVRATEIFIDFFKRNPDMTNIDDVKELLSIKYDICYAMENIVSRNGKHKENKVISADEFLNNCTACGGNWVAMLLSGIKAVFPDEYEFVVRECENIGYGKGGVPAFVFVCEWLAMKGIIFED